MGALVGALSVVRSQSEGDRTVNWLLPDVDVYHSEQPLDELRVKLDDFKSTEFTDESAEITGHCTDPDMKARFALMAGHGRAALARWRRGCAWPAIRHIR